MTTISDGEALIGDIDAYEAMQEEYGLDELSAEFVETIIDKILDFLTALVGHPLHPYQIPFARRIIHSVIVNDGDLITAQASRQSGKSETVADVVVTLMVLLPRLAMIYPDLLGRYKDGFWVGMFAPIESQAETLFGRAVTRLTSERAVEILGDPEIDDITKRNPGVTKGLALKKSGSMMLMMTANPRAKIESKTFHLAVLDECFPYDTPVLTNQGWLPIGEIVERGEDPSLLAATQETDGKIGYARVTTGYKTPRINNLVRVVHQYGTVYCTTNHPFVVGGTRVPAADLVPGTPLLLVPGSGEPGGETCAQGDDLGVLSGLLDGVLHVSSGGQGTAGRERASRRFAREGQTQPVSVEEHATQQPDEEPGDPSEGVAHLEADGASTDKARREWARSDGATEVATHHPGPYLDTRVCRPHWRSSGDGRTADPLQGGPGEPEHQGSPGDRRAIPQGAVQEGGGPAEGRVPIVSRVVSVEILQPSDSDWGRLGGCVDFVYTLEVDSPSHTYVAAGVLVGNCQEMDDYVISKSISPMLAYTSGTMVMTGTPARSKNQFYKAIQLNKRLATGRRGKQNHYEWNWKDVAKVNKNYEKFIKKEMLRIGEDSDEFLMSYQCKWMLERGMFITQTVFDELGDTSAQTVKSWHNSPVVVGIDPARKADSTVVTVLWVDWDRPDEFGYFDHRVLNWLEIQGDDWEHQYYEIVNFLAAYDVLAVGVDANGVGDAVAQRMKLLLPRAEVIPVTSSQAEQSRRYKHLQALLQRGMMSWPAHSKTRRLKTYQRFMQQMLDAEKKYQGQFFTVEAPDETGAHDDYVDSLAIAASMTADLTMPTVEVSNSPFFD